MKIVSHFKDYYDHFANILGVDETLRFERIPFVEMRLIDGSRWADDRVEILIPRSVADAFKTYRQENEHFFRELYRDEVNYRKQDHNDRRITQALFVGGRAFVMSRDIIGPLNVSREYEYSELIARYEVECPFWLNAIADIVSRPVFLVESMRGVGYAVDMAHKATLRNVPPNLSEMGLPRLLDGWNAYAAIQTWMENTRAYNEALNGIPPASNDVKIEAAGFDLKTSFRKR